LLHFRSSSFAEEGLRYRLEDGREFKSPSSAGSAIMGGSACNGWRFWSVAGTEAAKPKAAKKPPKKAKANPANGLITRLEDGRWFCNACRSRSTRRPAWSRRAARSVTARRTRRAREPELQGRRIERARQAPSGACRLWGHCFGPLLLEAMVSNG